MRKGVFGYTTGSPKLGDGGKFQIDRSKIVFDRAASDDEIDLQEGFLIIPDAIPAAAPQPGTSPTPREEPKPGGGPIVEPPSPLLTGPTGSAQKREVNLSFSADRDELFTAWKALANLADMATVTIHAEKSEGFDRSKLEKGVLEPLRESKLID